MATIQLLTVNYVDGSHSSAIVTVDNQKDVHIEVDKNFRIRCTDTKYSEKRVNYLRRFYYQISEKLMELSGIDSAQIQINLEKLKSEIKKGKTCEDFLKETKYANFAENFCLFISKYYINIDGRALYHDYDKEIAVYDIKDLKKCWKQFYNGDDLFGSYYRLCTFSASDYTYLIGLNKKMDNDEQYEWYDFVRRNAGCAIQIGKYEVYYSLDRLDQAYKDYTEKYFGYNPQDFFIDDNNELCMRGGKVLGYCNSKKNGRYTGEIKFENDINENLKKAVLNHFNSFGNTKWREVGKVEESIENKLAENFANKLKDLQKEGLFESIKSFDLSLNRKGINIKLNENIATPTVEELSQLETQFYNLVGACEKYDYECRSKFSDIYLVYLDDSESCHNYDEDGNPEGGRSIIEFTKYSLDKIEDALNGDGKLVGVMCEYLAQEADPKDLFMSKLKRNNFIKKFCDKYHLTPMFYIGSRNRGDEEWDDNWVDICSEIYDDYFNESDDSYYDECTMTGPFGEKYEF